MANNAASVLSIARGELGYSRWDDPEPGTIYGRWYESTIDRTHDNYDFGGSGVPYCAMFVSWVLDKAGVGCAGVPGAYCPSMLAVGNKLSTSNAQPGDVVYFDWEGDGTSDHVGFVEINAGSYLQCIEGNTSNGCVARRTRAYGSVVGIVRPNYGSSDTPSEPPAPSVPDNPSITVDGAWGSATTQALQVLLGAPYVDGVISRQNARCGGANPGLTYGWEWLEPPVTGSQTIELLQERIGAEADGVMGSGTIAALQRHFCTCIDGSLGNPSPCIEALQRAINSGSI